MLHNIEIFDQWYILDSLSVICHLQPPAFTCTRSRLFSRPIKAICSVIVFPSLVEGQLLKPLSLITNSDIRHQPLPIHSVYKSIHACLFVCLLKLQFPVNAVKRVNKTVITMIIELKMNECTIYSLLKKM